jgi:ribosomal protein L17
VPEVNRIIKNAVVRKRRATKPQISALAVRLIKDKSIVISIVEAKELRLFTDKLIRVAKRGDPASQRRVSSLLRDPEAVNILFADIAPKLTAGNRSLIQVLESSSHTRGRSHTSVVELVLDGGSFEQASIQGRHLPGSARREVVHSKIGSVIEESQQAARLSLATIDGRLGADELRIISRGLGIPVRALTRPEHWTLGLGALNKDKGNPILLRVVRGPLETGGLNVELAWRGKAPSKRLVAQVKKSISLLEVELAEKKLEVERNEAEASSRNDAALVLILQGVPGRVTPAEPQELGLYPSSTPDVAKLLRSHGLNVDFEHDRMHREYLTLHAAEHWLPVVEVNSRFLRGANSRMFTRLVEDYILAVGADSILHVRFRIRNDGDSVNEFSADGPAKEVLVALGKFEKDDVGELEA